MIQKRKCQLALWLIAALLTGVLAEGHASVAEETSAAAQSRRELHAPTVNQWGDVSWDCIYFGNYWQEDTNGDGRADRRDVQTPIKWRVLSVDGNDAFLLADKNLATRRYSEDSTEMTWETSSLRSWLNGYGAEENTANEDYLGTGFLNEAFSKAEQQAIQTTTVVNEDNPKYDTAGGNDTSDKVYVPSMSEMTNPAYGFSEETTAAANRCRQAVNTELTIAQGGYNSEVAGYLDNGIWWLRTPGYQENLVTHVSREGDIGVHGWYASTTNRAVRPVLHLNLSEESVWAWAGRVDSLDREFETAAPPADWQSSQTPMPNRIPTAPSNAPSGDGTDYGLKNPTTDSDGITTWDCVEFGRYWMDDDSNYDYKVDREDEKVKLRWRVLSVNGDDAFLLADKIVDCQRYNSEYRAVTWEMCTLRSWLNGYGAESNASGQDYRGQGFLNDAFTESEQQLIRTATVINEDNYYFGTEGGADTEDKIYLLSADEVDNPAYGFAADGKHKQASYLPFVRTQEAWLGEFIKVIEGIGEVQYGQWWLRSPGARRECAVRVDAFGYYTGGMLAGPGWTAEVNASDMMVRPVLHLKLSTDAASGEVPLWKRVGTVNSAGGSNIVYYPDPQPTATVRPTETPVPDTRRQGKTEENENNEKEDVEDENDKVSTNQKPGKVQNVKLSQKKRTLTVKWKNVSRADGYQVCYSTSPSWKGKKQKQIFTNKVTLKKLKRKKVYYVRVRAWRVKGTKNIYGAWSKTRKIRMKG